MRIDFIEVANFRKLLAVRVDIAIKSTVFVGANNSGKTSAMVALRHFLVPADHLAHAGRETTDDIRGRRRRQ